ncbi:DUF3306 domain-containing protein [Methylobacterium iners]|uniref:DUF3306 domain-containing protein n=1 Tax=Methylobacterium iners TaxID=418707 RepID=A0ABQ4RVS2_9HYPH|nr:DUF3306 domain-containing protein [Methylobacterium iners]GJD94941.1 hypothetical protein OCOJLMKI_2148 [Methylobacterium iners]
MSDGFLGRWSRRKREIIEAEGKAPEVAAPDAPLEEGSEPDAETAEAIAALPPIESLTAESDIGQFLRAGVPHVLRNAALRRMWSLDPSIRDYLCEAREYAYDWNVVGGVPGQGPLLPTDDVEGMLRQVFAGTDVIEEVEPQPVAEGGIESAEPAGTAGTETEVSRSSGISAEDHREHLQSARQVERGSPLLGGEGQGEGGALTGEFAPLAPAPSPWEGEPVSVPAQGGNAVRESGPAETGTPEPARVRRHGGAVPI